MPDYTYIWLKDGKPWKETEDIEGKRISKENFPNNVSVEYYYYSEDRSTGNPTLKKKVWYKGTDFHRDGDKPAYIVYDKSGNIIEKTWYKNNDIYRDDDKPAVVHYKSGNVSKEVWYLEGERLGRRNDKPAVIAHWGDGVTERSWYDNGVRKKAWYKGEKLHRIHNPAVAYYDKNGWRTKYEWWVDGVKTIPNADDESKATYTGVSIR